MKSSVIFKNPDKPVNHKPMIAAGAVVAYNLLKSKDSSSVEKNNNHTSNSSSSGLSAEGVAFISVFTAIFSPLIGLFVAVITTNDNLGLIAIPVVLVLCLISFIYALNMDE